MTEHAPDRIWTSIDIPKTIAGVLATVSAAVLGSFLGVAGTLVGAAMASLIGTIGTEVYHRSISKGARKLQSSFVTAPAAVGTPTVAAAGSEVPSEPEPPRNIRWGRVAAVAASIFLLAIGTLTAFELISGKSAADAVGNKSGSSTTVGTLLGGTGKHTTPTPAPSSSATPTGTTTTTGATKGPAKAATTTAPTIPAPATDAPAQTVAPTATGQATAGDIQNQNPQQGVG